MRRSIIRFTIFCMYMISELGTAQGPTLSVLSRPPGLGRSRHDRILLSHVPFSLGVIALRFNPLAVALSEMVKNVLTLLRSAHVLAHRLLTYLSYVVGVVAFSNTDWAVPKYFPVILTKCCKSICALLGRKRLTVGFRLLHHQSPLFCSQ